MDKHPIKPHDTKHRLRRVLAVAFVIVLWLPMLQKWTGLLPKVPLFGVESSTARPALSWRTWFSGDYARLADRRLTERIGLRGLFVRLANQTKVSLFRKPPQSMGSPVIVGEDYWLYEAEYARHYTRRPGMPPESRKTLVDQLSRLQSALEARGIAFLLVISPSKCQIYPEYMPATMHPVPELAAQPNAYEQLLPELKAAGLHVADAHVELKRLKPQHPFLFARGGTHWTYTGSFLFTQELLRELNNQRPPEDRFPLPAMTGTTNQPPIGTDNDLRALLNLLWFERGGEAPVPYPITETPSALPIAERTDLLIIGDSFSYTLVDSLALSRTARTIDLLYYFKRRFHYPLPDTLDGWVLPHADFDTGPIDPARLDPGELLLSKDAVILEINEIMLDDRGWGFPAWALSVLQPGE